MAKTRNILHRCAANAMGAIGKVLELCYAPVRKNGLFFISMYLLGIVCTYAVKSKYTDFYDYAWQELFVDVYALCVLLVLLPGRVRRWVRRVFYVLAYTVAVVDVYCFVKFDSTITPTMLLLVGETNSREAGEFLSSYLSPDVVFSRLGWVLLVLLAHVSVNVVRKLWKGKRRAWHLRRGTQVRAVLGLLMLLLFVGCLDACWHNKVAFHRLMTFERIGDVEHELTDRKHHAQLYQPLYRLAFSIYANRLTAKQLVKLTANINKVAVDSCSFTSPNIVLIIGESYNRHHAQMYGYPKENTPRQVERARRGELVLFDDVVAPWNLTSFVFKHLFSLYSVGDEGEWCDYPLFPELFRKAGYHVTFLTNQFLPKAGEQVYDFSGGFFLNHPELSNAMFDTRNEQLYYFDEGLLKEYDRLKEENRACNLTIFHLKGLHVDYRTRCPKSQQHFAKDDYDRPGFSPRERQVMAYYDNAILYNDSIVDQIIRRFEEEDAIVIYVPDHGEEVYEGNVHFFGRMHSTEITARLAHAEFEIPFWIYCSGRYRKNHPDVYSRVVGARSRRYMTDALPHLLLYLGGIHTKDYREKQNLLSPDYDERRPRILKNTTDYDSLMVKEREKTEELKP